MSYMHISIPSTPTSMDTNSLASPRNELISILQKEQDEALALLEANPFISSLLVKYSKGGATKATPSENEELVALKAEMKNIRQDYARLFTDLETVKQQKKAAETISVGLEIQLASAVEEKKKGAEEIDSLKNSLSQTEANLFDAREELSDTKLRSEENIADLRRELSETKENAVKESARAASEIKSLKNRCDVLWETISERRPDVLQPPTPTAEVVEKKEEESKSEPPARFPSEDISTPSDVLQDILSVKPPWPTSKSRKAIGKSKGPGFLVSEVEVAQKCEEPAWISRQCPVPATECELPSGSSGFDFGSKAIPGEKESSAWRGPLGTPADKEGSVQRSGWKHLTGKAGGASSRGAPKQRSLDAITSSPVVEEKKPSRPPSPN